AGLALLNRGQDAAGQVVAVVSVRAVAVARGHGCGREEERRRALKYAPVAARAAFAGGDRLGAAADVGRGVVVTDAAAEELGRAVGITDALVCVEVHPGVKLQGVSA